MENKMPYHECPSFNTCNSNICPLDPFPNDKYKLPGEAKCKGEKPMRMRIAAKYPELLVYKGLTRKQFMARERWEALSPEEKELMRKSCVKMKKTHQN